jgi:hypothetical protein
VSVNQAEVQRLLDEKQYYFLPYYDSVVSRHPLGIEAADVKARVRDEIVAHHGFDPFDEAITRVNPSTGVSAASQWANNLVSNRVLEQYMVVTRGGHRAVLYPLSGDDNSRPVDDGFGAPPPIGDELEEAADDRPPVFEETERGRYRRSAALAELVRQRADYQCIVNTDDCVTFLGANGTPYIEVHHIIPMAMQGSTGYNLDRVANMVAICVACHTKLHKGSRQIAAEVLTLLLERYEVSRGSTLTALLGDCDVPHTVDDLLDYCASI